MKNYTGISYETQWNKITSAYVNNQLTILDACACFIGNLLNNNSAWDSARAMWGVCTTDKGYIQQALKCIEKEAGGIYTIQQILDMEKLCYITWQEGGKTEESLYEAMVSTLEMLRKLHENMGDETAKEIILERRKIQELCTN